MNLRRELECPKLTTWSVEIDLAFYHRQRLDKKKATNASQQKWEDAQPVEAEEVIIVEIVDGSRKTGRITDGGASPLTSMATE